MYASASPFLQILLFILVTWLPGSWLPCALAQAQAFTTHQREGGQDFTYIYPTPGKSQQTLNLRLNLDDISRGSAEFKPWNEQEARAYAVAATAVAAQKLNADGLTVTVENLPNGMAIRATGTNPRLAEKGYMQRLEQTLQPAYQAALESYARARYYKVAAQSPTVSTVMPDHPAIAIRYTAAMGPVARAIQAQVPGAKASPRAFINAALNWLQTVPYDTLENRATSNGAGFQTPYGMMLGNLGDCDTKAVALASLIRSAYPQIPLAIAYVPDHAFLAIGLPQQSHDYALRTPHGTYILADPTGPRLTPLGFIDEPTRAKIRTAQTDVVPIR